MRFLFSNRRLWHTYYGILISISVVFILLSFLSYQSLILLIMYILLSIGSAVLALKMVRLNSSYYLLFDKTNFEVHRIFSKEVTSYDYEDVKLIAKQASQIEIQFRDGKRVLIHLEYLNAEDVAKLLMYLKFHPMISSGKKNFL